MSKNLSVKRTLFTGTLLLTAAGILSRFIVSSIRYSSHAQLVQKVSEFTS